MKTFFKRSADRLMLVLVAAFALGGCAIYDTGPGYYDTGDVAYGSPSVYVRQPVYVPPPSFHFSIRSSSWGHSHHRYNGRRWHRGPGKPGGHGRHRGRGGHGGHGRH